MHKQIEGITLYYLVAPVGPEGADGPVAPFGSAVPIGGGKKGAIAACNVAHCAAVMGMPELSDLAWNVRLMLPTPRVFVGKLKTIMLLMTLLDTSVAFLHRYP